MPTPAAFRRLCVETGMTTVKVSINAAQPPSGGCVLKPHSETNLYPLFDQPPSGGCVLKPSRSCVSFFDCEPAAFRRLCVETIELELMDEYGMPAAFRRLCVETSRLHRYHPARNQPPSGGCVLKLTSNRCFDAIVNQPPSGGCVLKQAEQPKHYQQSEPAAFRRLCVETVATESPSYDTSPAAFRRLCVETINLIQRA